jgi:hypothetical protein
VIHAWELQNEPVWNTYFGAPDHVAGGKTVERTHMRVFLEEGLDRIRKHKVFRSTVGHRFVDDLAAFPTGTGRQFHYYPKDVLGVTVVDRTLPDFTTTRAFVGEFGAMGKDANGNYPHGHPWPGSGRGRQGHPYASP